MFLALNIARHDFAGHCRASKAHLGGAIYGHGKFAMVKYIDSPKKGFSSFLDLLVSRWQSIYIFRWYFLVLLWFGWMEHWITSFSLLAGGIMYLHGDNTILDWCSMPHPTWLSGSRHHGALAKQHSFEMGQCHSLDLTESTWWSREPPKGSEHVLLKRGTVKFHQPEVSLWIELIAEVSRSCGAKCIWSWPSSNRHKLVASWGCLMEI